METEESGVYEVRFHNLSQLDTAATLKKRFKSLSLFYEEASAHASDTCPSFYRFKMTQSLQRVYEVEEHMGGVFIEELGKMHGDYLKLMEH